MKKLIYLTTVVLILSCNNEKKYDLTLIGNINNIVNGKIELFQDGDKINGVFTNLENAKTLMINGVIINNKLKFYEFQKNNKISGIFEGTLSNGFFKGKWFNKKKTIKKSFSFKQKITETNIVDSKVLKETVNDSNKKEVYLLENLLVYNSHKQLEQKFGKKNVRIKTGYYPEGMGEYKYSVLYKNSNKEVEFYWENEVGLKTLNGVRISKESIWKTKQGITYGTKSTTLEELNGKPFSYVITCSECDAPQEIFVNWENGKLANTNIEIAIYPKASTETDTENRPKYYSNHRYTRNTKVIELFLSKK